jgi:hypothetical protein
MMMMVKMLMPMLLLLHWPRLMQPVHSGGLHRYGARFVTRM